MCVILSCCESASNSPGFLQPAVIAAIIAAIVSIPGIWMNIRSQRIQRSQSERNEIYKKLNDFYGPIRLLLRNSEELYVLLKKSILGKIENEKYRTLPFILEGNKFDKTEDALIKRIIKIGKKIEKIIEKNAGLIDDDDLNKEMIALSTHIRIIRMAYNGDFQFGNDAIKLFDGKTFPNEITDKVNATFNSFKAKLDELNKKAKKQKK